VNGRWRQRKLQYHKPYQFRQLRGQAWCIGQRRDGSWWVAHARRVGQQKTFAPVTFASEREAKTAAVTAAVLTAPRPKR